jgi:hypothetical protein
MLPSVYRLHTGVEIGQSHCTALEKHCPFLKSLCTKQRLLECPYLINHMGCTAGSRQPGPPRQTKNSTEAPFRLDFIPLLLWRQGDESHNNHLWQEFSEFDMSILKSWKKAMCLDQHEISHLSCSCNMGGWITATMWFTHFSGTRITTFGHAGI